MDYVEGKSPRIPGAWWFARTLVIDGQVVGTFSEEEIREAQKRAAMCSGGCCQTTGFKGQNF